MPPKTRNSISDDFCPVKSAKEHVQELDLILQNVLLKERSESVILCGPSGCGKSRIVQKALQPYRQNKRLWSSFDYIYLDGRSEGEPQNAVDSILSQIGSGRSRDDGSVAGSVAEKLAELCDTLKNHVSQTNKGGLLFVIDRLEGLVEHDNQMLLYTLLDAAHANGFPVAVIAISTSMDVVDKLEKRVRSRFSHRVIDVSKNLFADFEEYEEGFLFCTSRMLKLERNRARSLIGQAEMEICLRKLFHYRKDWNTIYRVLFMAASRAGAEGVPVDATHLTAATALIMIDTTVTMIKNLPALHVALLLCCFEYASAQEECTFNFCVIFELYNALTKQKIKSLRYGENMVMAAFCDLESYGLLKMSPKIQNEPWRFRMVSLGVARLQLRQAIREIDFNAVNTELRMWCKEYS